MGVEENKAVVRRELLAMAGDYDVLDEIIAPSYESHDPNLLEPVIGPEGLKKLIAAWRDAFPDLTVTIDQQVGEGDYVVSRWTATGTHNGPFQGVEPTGKQIKVSGIGFGRVENGKVVDEWESWDRLGLLQQLGAAPSNVALGLEPADATSE